MEKCVKGQKIKITCSAQVPCKVEGPWKMKPLACSFWVEQGTRQEFQGESYHISCYFVSYAELRRTLFCQFECTLHNHQCINREKLSILMSDKHIKATANFIWQCFHSRQKTWYNTRYPPTWIYILYRLRFKLNKNKNKNKKKNKLYFTSVLK